MENKKSFSKFQENVRKLDKEIVKRYKKFETKKSFLITDGIVDEMQYYNSKIKILWILKEAYCEGDSTGGGWSLVKQLLTKKNFINEIGRSKKTWSPIIYTSYGILNKFISWDEMADVEKKPEMTEIFKKIAVINVRKLPGYTTSNMGRIAEAYNQTKDILLKQIEVYNPNVLIFGYTFGLFRNDLKIPEETFYNKKYQSIEYYNAGNKLYIDAFHPAQRKICVKEYCNDIINLVKDWSMKKKK